MYKHIVTFFRFFLPIVRKAALEVAADEIARLAYPERRPFTSYNRYAHRAPRSQREAVRNVGRAVREADEFRPRTGPNPFTTARDEVVENHRARPSDDNEAGDRCKDCGLPVTWIGPSQYDWEHVDEKDDTFDGTVSVTFDLSGPDSENVRNWLLDNMPDPGVYGEEDEIRLNGVQVN